MGNEPHGRALLGDAPTTRRAFLTALAGATSLGGQSRRSSPSPNRAADVNLRIQRSQIEVARGKAITTSTYNGTAPGPVIHMEQGFPATVEIVNHTDVPEYVHWHGFEAPPELDGTEEEGSLVVPPGGRLRYELTPVHSGSRYVHSHAMAMSDLSRGVYSGQFAFVYVEPRRNPGRYDQEIFLSTHEWQPRFVREGEAESAEEEEDEGGESGSMEIHYGIRSINGKALGHGAPLRVKEGQRVLFHILNASATENIQLYLPGHTFYVVGLDGNAVPRPRYVSVLELGVGERVDAIVQMNNPGVWILGSVAEDVRQSGLGIRLEYSSRRGEPQHAAAGNLPWDYVQFGLNKEGSEPDEIIPMRILRVPPPDPQGMEEWTINGRSYSDQDAPKVLTKGRRYRLAFDNRTAEAHPLHLHRHTFELVRVGAKVTSGVMKDVIVLQPYQTAEVDFVPRHAGLTLFHCHQQMHMERGFKRLFRVI